MRELLDCLDAWLAKNDSSANAHSLLRALASETRKRLNSPDKAQREFDAQQLAMAAGRDQDFEAAKQWVVRADMAKFIEARNKDFEAHFRAAGHSHALRVVRRPTSGKHRAVWFLEPYDLPLREPEPPALEPEGPAAESAALADLEVRYELTPPDKIRMAWYAKPLLGAGSFVTRSWRGILWITFAAGLGAIGLVGVAGQVVLLSQLHRPLHTSDLATLLFVCAAAWLLWYAALRPLGWLLEGGIVLASEVWVDWNEPPGQLELHKDEAGRKVLRLVRYRGVCPLCAGSVELGYSTGADRRRVLGRCRDEPLQHVYSFDRVLRVGQRVRA